MLQKVDKVKLIKRPKSGPFKLDLGCGDNKNPEGFFGVDIVKFPCVDYVFDLTKRWPLADLSVDEVHCAHTMEHFTGQERCFFVNELWRVLTKDGTAKIVVPHWSSCRSYGDPTHKWPPMSEFFWFYLDRDWRLKEAPHTDVKYLPWGFDTDFETTWGYGMAPSLMQRSEDFKQFAVNYYKEAVFDIHASLKKKP